MRESQNDEPSNADHDGSESGKKVSVKEDEVNKASKTYM